MVREVFDISSKRTDEGRFTYFILKKRNYTTLKALQVIARQLGIELKKISFCGNKDKKAITEQTISILGKARAVNMKDIELTFIGYGNEPISLGEHSRNEFIITARNLANMPEVNSLEYFPNYFDTQRFSKNNAQIGKLLIMQNYKQAAELIAQGGESPVSVYLTKHHNDFVGALRLVPKKLLQLYVHSYQSLLWNTVLKMYIEHEHIDLTNLAPQHKTLQIPLLGFATEFDDELLEKLYETIMETELISSRDFIIRAMPELSSDGAQRNAFAQVHGLQVFETGEDEFNSGKKKIKIRFELGKGCYATTALAYLLGAQDAS